MDFSIKKAVSYHHQAHDYLREKIIRGEFLPGERIYEAKIARTLEISRSPVREAIRSLEQEGLLVIDEKSRIFVYEPTIKDVEDIYQCRQALESVAVVLATRLASDQTLEYIADLLQNTKEVFNKGEKYSIEQIVELNSKYHDLIIEASQNIRLKRQLNDLRSLTFFYRTMNVENSKRCLEILEQHEEIIHFMRARDVDRAAAAMSTHIAQDLNYLKEILI
ncbi:GntR family transcriptional regulator [Halalkalibacter nanhaiisediminis]|uniref:Transcriptional regulator, GntR family n=1 Tax=Halalkalibacter nanhaiisediminis TaxID=688079 RepID=A0A562QQV8_9BACI|nr:GntR family transcriptional regulator [Halalkalibacter nanhaiisediminis]TWI59129.1 transcriptional regulator, GntR family [Halalkalibacter nanhaiisediminis]